MIRFDVITLFPEMFSALTENGVSRRALQQNLYQLKCINPRKFTKNKHNTVDDRPYGGGPGMLMMYAPLKASVEFIEQETGSKPYVIYLSPQGKPLNQSRLNKLKDLANITLVCGRYEGLDERFIDAYVDEEICIGDFVVSGGELPAMMLIDSLVRLLPGALGHKDSAVEDSFFDGLLDCPHYTRPVEIDGLKVPAILQSGNHAKIADWRHEQKVIQTQKKRPDLYKIYTTK